MYLDCFAFVLVVDHKPDVSSHTTVGIFSSSQITTTTIISKVVCDDSWLLVDHKPDIPLHATVGIFSGSHTLTTTEDACSRVP